MKLEAKELEHYKARREELILKAAEIACHGWFRRLTTPFRMRRLEYRASVIQRLIDEVLKGGI